MLLLSCRLHLFHQGSWNLYFENLHGLALALDHDVAEGPYLKVTREPRARGLADDNAGLVFLVQRFQPGPQVYVVADYRVTHDGGRPDVTRDHVAGVDADANIKLRHPLAEPDAVQFAEFLHHVDRRLDRMIRVTRIVQRGAEERHHHVPDELIDRALVAEHDFDHPGEVLVQLPDELLGIAALGDGREPPDVRKQHRHVAPLPPKLRLVGVGHEL